MIMRRLQAIVALVLLLSAVRCTKTLDINLDIVPACDQPDALDGMQSLTLRAEGDALDTPRERTFEAASGGGRLPAIPPTSNGRLTVLARRGTEDSPVDVAGASGPYDFTGQDDSVGTQVRVVVGRTGTFVGTSSGLKPAQCTSMVRGRHHHSATRLLDGRILIAGGEERQAGEILLLRNTELYDPESGTFIAGPDLPEGRSHHTASLLPSGRVLVCGGLGARDNQAVALASCLLFDPESSSFLGSEILLNSARLEHRAVTLPDDRVVLLGGRSGGSDYVATTEIFDPSIEPPMQRLSPGPNLLFARAEHTATLLVDGDILVAGGRDEDEAIGVIEVFGVDGTRKIADGVARYGHAAARTGDGRVVIAGGFTSIVDGSLPMTTGAVEIFDPAGGGSIACGEELSLASPRGDLFAASLGRSGDGRYHVLFAGGAMLDGAVTPLAETVALGRGRACSDVLVELARGQMKLARMSAVPVTLFGGDVLVTGGATATGADSGPASVGEVFIAPR